jgi:hypothetical protein
VLSLRAACTLLVRELSATYTKLAHAAAWPAVTVGVSFGWSVLPLPMTVLDGSVAAKMREMELGARLTSAARAGVDQSALMQLCSRLAVIPPQSPARA